MNRTDRLYALVEELRAVAPRARTARQLAERFEVSLRTIERDISALQQSGVPIWATPGPGGGYTVDPALTLPPLNFTPGEATAIAVALASRSDMPLAESARSALRKVVAAMSQSERTRAAALVERMRVLRREGAIPRTAVLSAVEEAVLTSRVLSIDYVDRDGRRTDSRLVEPFGFAGVDDTWYLMAWCRLRGGGRSFRLDRVVAAAVIDETAPPRDEDQFTAGMPAEFFRLQLE
jgi:predicted DNA-binding transcriptional regulator YafY